MRRLRRVDAAPPAKRDPLLSGVLAHAHRHAQHLLHTSPAKRVVKTVATNTAKSAKDQTAKALGLGNNYKPDFSAATEKFQNDWETGIADLMEKSLDRATDVLNEWSDLDPDRSERADEDGLDGMLRDGLDGISGSALSLAAIGFGYLFGGLIRTAQTEAGVTSYKWMAQHDSVVRPEHVALDNGDTYDWDDPPLDADESSSGEECHPGEDYNCRCVASPVTPDEE